MKILVAGAGATIGREIVCALRSKGAEVTATYRTSRPGIEEKLSSMGAAAMQLDLTDVIKAKALLKDVDAAVFAPILSVSGALANLLRDDQRAVFFSSNNVAIVPGTDVYAQLLEIERAVTLAAPQAVILRPTMIYGYPGDGNLSRLMMLMRRFSVAPLIGASDALQQPVYYKALAQVAVNALFAPPGHPRRFAVAGPQPITKRALFDAVALAAGAQPLIVPLPIAGLAPILRVIEKSGLYLPVSSDQIARAELDKIPAGEHAILTDMKLEAGLAALAAALDAGLDEAPAGA